MKSTLLLLFALFCSNSFISQTIVGGGIYSNSSFVLASSPYLVTSNLVVFPNVVLSIEPGVELKFDAGVYLEVRGEVIAIGNELSRIKFTSSSSSPNKGDWEGVRIKNTLGGKGSFKNCDFDFANVATEVECCNLGGPVYYEKCFFENNNTGIGGYTGYEILIDECYFNNNLFGVTHADKNITNSTFENNEYGLYETERIDLNNVTFTNNQIAIYGGRGLLQNSSITNNIIGVKSFYEGFQIENNDISYNNIGIQTANDQPYAASVKNNTICNNQLYNAENLGNLNIDLTENCWCSDIRSEIESKLKDGYDDVNLGLFNYSIYDDSCTFIINEVIKFTNIASINDEDLLEGNISFFPNPVTSDLFVITAQSSNEIKIQILNLNGDLISENEFHDTNDMKVNLTFLASGCYIINIFSANQKISRMLMKD